MKLCVDCKWLTIRTWSDKFNVAEYLCQCPRRKSPVDGKPYEKEAFRARFDDGDCDLEAHWFEAK